MRGKLMATTELGAWWRSGAALKYAFHKMQKSPWVWTCVQASPPMVAAYASALFISRGKCSLGVSRLSMATVLLSVALHLWLRVRGRRQAAAHVTCAGLLTFEIIWLCELLLMEADDLRRWSSNTQDSAAIIALGLFATGTWIGSQRGHLSRELYALAPSSPGCASRVPFARSPSFGRQMTLARACYSALRLAHWCSGRVLQTARGSFATRLPSGWRFKARCSA